MADYTNEGRLDIEHGEANYQEFVVQSTYEFVYGQFVGCNSSGRVRPFSSVGGVASYRFVGVCAGYVNNSTGGGNRSAFVRVFTGAGKDTVFGPYTVTHSAALTWSLAMASGGCAMHAYNSSMLCTAIVASTNPIGKVFRIDQADEVYVQLIPAFFNVQAKIHP